MALNLNPHFLLHPSPPIPSSSSFSHSTSLSILRPPTTITTRSLTLCSVHNSQWFVQLSEQITSSIEEGGPIELPPGSSMTSLFATTDDPSFLQTATSVLLTGSITVFLFRSLRRRAKRAKELTFRSSGAKKSLKDEALESLKAVSLSPVNGKAPPSPVQAFLGAITAGVIALILYKFTTTIEFSLNKQTLSDNYSVRQITITIRTIINGLCYLATFVFGFNALGLLAYSGQLAMNSFKDEFGTEGNAPLGSSNSTLGDTGGSEIPSSTEEKSSDDMQQ